jgi:hypothetical protein
LVKRLRRHEAELFTFLDHPDVPSDNNHSGAADPTGRHRREKQPRKWRLGRRRDTGDPDELVPDLGDSNPYCRRNCVVLAAVGVDLSECLEMGAIQPKAELAFSAPSIS